MANITARRHVVLLTFDEPECGHAADVLGDMILKEVKMLAERVNVPALTVQPVPVTHGLSHRDLLHRALQEINGAKQQDCFVISLLKGGNSVEYHNIKELCNHTRPRLAHQVVTHLSGFNDVGLVLRNLVRRVTQVIVEGDAGSQLIH